MTIKLLWPVRRGDHSPELEAAGEGVDCFFVDSVAEVSDELWRNCHAIFGGYDCVPSEYMDKLDHCKLFVTPKVGFDNIDIKKFGDYGIPVCNVPDYGTHDVADHAMGLLMSLMKGISRYDNAVRRDPLGGWRVDNHPIALRLSDAKLGIVGLGRIGTAMALRCNAFGMGVSFYHPYKENGFDLALGYVEFAASKKLFAESDIITLHVPLNDETHNLVDAQLLAKAKKGMVLINAARGAIVDIDALYDAMKTDHVAAAGLDVLPEEPADLDRPLIAAWHNEEDWIHGRVLITPHAGAFTPQSHRDMRTKGVEATLRYLRTGRLENCVNADYLVDQRNVGV